MAATMLTVMAAPVSVLPVSAATVTRGSLLIFLIWL